jgi:hypothetical protein
MPSSGMLRHMVLVRTDVSEEFLCSVLGLLVTATVHSLPILATLIMEAIYSSETSVLKRATRCNMPEYGILQVSFRRNLSKTSALASYHVNQRFRRLVLGVLNMKAWRSEVNIPLALCSRCCNEIESMKLKVQQALGARCIVFRCLMRSAAVLLVCLFHIPVSLGY